MDFFGEGHTRDKGVVWFKNHKVMFGKCRIKEQGADKGNLVDANTSAWAETVKKFKSRYPEV